MKRFWPEKAALTKEDKGTAPWTADPFTALQREVNRVLDSFRPGGWEALLSGPAAEVAAITDPKVNVSETAEAVMLSAEVPGMKADQLELHIEEDGRTLVLSGEKRYENKEEREGLVRSERAFGRFERHLLLPAVVLADRIEAVCKDGVLTVKMAKAPQEQQSKRRIPVK